MWQLWTRASHRRWFLVVAATSVITLAASSPIYSAARGGHVTAGSRAATADCSVAAADELVKRLRLSDPEVANPVFKVLCGAFTGPESQTMVVSLLGPGSTGMIDWVVFRSTADDWQFLMKRHQSAVLTAAGSDIRELVWIFRLGDSRCCPSGGTKARIWHWDGTRFTAGPWKQITKGEPEPRAFHSPSGGIECGMGDARGYRGVACHSHHIRPLIFNAVTMDARGRLKTCRGSFARCRLGQVGDVPTLGYGRQITVGRFRCLSRRLGVRCTVITSGKGFLINRTGVKRAGP